MISSLTSHVIVPKSISRFSGTNDQPCVTLLWLQPEVASGMWDYSCISKFRGEVNFLQLVCYSRHPVEFRGYWRTDGLNSVLEIKYSCKVASPTLQTGVFCCAGVPCHIDYSINKKSWMSTHSFNSGFVFADCIYSLKGVTNMKSKELSVGQKQALVVSGWKKIENQSEPKQNKHWP